MSLRFEIESEGKTKKSPKYSTAEIYICLNRYGLVSTTENIKETQVFPDKSLFHQIYHYSYCRRYLRNGYIYIYNETKKTINEYLTENGSYYNVLKDLHIADILSLSDNRPADKGIKNQYFIGERQKSTLWLIYSNVQWTAEYIKEYVDDTNKFRSIRGQKFETQKSVANNLGYIGTTKIYCKPISEKERTDEGNPDSEFRSEHRYTEIVAERCYRNVEKGVATMEEKLRKYMVTFSLHDPVGCADDLSDEYARQTEFHTALIQGLPYAKTPQEMLENKNNPFFLNIYSPESIQNSALYQSASLINEMILKNGVNNNNYGYTLNRDWIQKVLAIDDRKESFEQMIKTHMTLGVVLSSNYYQNALIDIYEASFKELAKGQNIVLIHHKLLAFAPNYIENGLGQEYYRTYWKDYMYNSFYYGNNTPQKPVVRDKGDLQYVVRELLNIDFRKTNLFKILNKSNASEKITETNQEIENEKSEAEKSSTVNASVAKTVVSANDLAINVDASLGLYQFFLKTEQDKQQYLSRIESITNMKKGAIQSAKHSLDVLTEQLVSKKLDTSVEFLSGLNWFNRTFKMNTNLNKLDEKLTILEDSYTIEHNNIVKLQNKKTIEYNEEIRILNEEHQRLEGKLKRVSWLDSKVYKKLFSTLSIANLIFTSKDLNKESFSDWTYFIGNASETTSVLLSATLSEARNEQILKGWLGASNVKFTLAARVGVVATCVLSVSTIWDGVNLYNRMDYTAAGFYIASGVTGFASGLVLWQGFATSASILGPWGWGLIIASFALLIIGDSLKKKDLERFLQSTVFGNRSDNKIAIDGKTPCQMMKRLYNDGKPNAKIFEDGNEEKYDLKNFREMLRYLFDTVAYFSYVFVSARYFFNGKWNIITRFELVFKFRPVLSFAKLEYTMYLSYNDGANRAYIAPVDGSPYITNTEDGFISVRFIFDLDFPPTHTISIYQDTLADKPIDPVYQTTDTRKGKITIQNLKQSPPFDDSVLNLNNGIPKKYCFAFRIIDKDELMSLPLSPELDDPLYYVVEGDLYSPYIATGVNYSNNPFMQQIDPHFSYPQSRCGKKTKKELSL